MFKLTALILFVTLYSSADAFWASCPGINGPTRIESPSCTATRCVATRGEPLIAHAFLSFARSHAALNVRVTAFVLGIGIPLPQEPPYDNACNSLFNQAGVRQSCPTTPGANYVWTIDMIIPTTYPPFNNARVRFELLEHGVVEFCADVTADLL